MRSPKLPEDLVAFLRAGKQLKYEAPRCECGRVELCPLSELYAEEIAVEFFNYDPPVEDPHEEDTGLYLTESVNLVRSCQDYDPEHILCWLPRIGCYGTYDVEHCELTMFPRKSWTDIAGDPLPYLNAQWRGRKIGYAQRALPTTPGIEWAARRKAPGNAKRGRRRAAPTRERFRPATPYESRVAGKPGQLFWIITNSMMSESFDDMRWEVDLADVQEKWALGRDPPVALRRVSATARRASGLEDVPMLHTNVIIVSNRVRAVFEREGPGDCQFVPVEIRCRGKLIEEGYWVLVPLREFDCLDPGRSLKYDEPDRNGDPWYHRIAIDPSRVPETVSTFRVKYFGSRPVVRDSLRRALRRERVTGVDFYEL